ncbi:MAG: Nif3-like dinuclear metal center hexameric protein, partial [Lachnospiraceae bacterium]|nr:Nif3-like dinuclear metal center hexameric protein [Lachnospiraceae bacterium]
MLISTLIRELKSQAIDPPESTVDTIKHEGTAAETDHVGVCFIATAEVIEKAKASGIGFLITHEPLYYDHFDRIREPHPVVYKKREAVEKAGITIWRYHDYMHRLPTDGIVEGILWKLNWKATPIDRQIWELSSPRSAADLSEDIRLRLHCGG